MSADVADVLDGSARWALAQGEALAFLRSLPDASVDAVVTDPPYPEIDRPYGRMTEGDWHALMRGVVAECRRVLRPKGSAVFILQPNSEHVGRMRPWLWEFMAETSRSWNMVQDAWWWNPAAMPTVHCSRINGLMRPSVKACVWLGAPDCYRDQGSVLWQPSEAAAAADRSDRALRNHPSGAHVRPGRASGTATDRGGSTPFNLLPLSNTDSASSAGAHGHGAGTPLALARWWVRYLCPAGGVALDPFAGVASIGVAALEQGRRYVGVERMPDYVAAGSQRLADAARQGLLPLAAGGDR